MVKPHLRIEANTDTDTETDTDTDTDKDTDTDTGTDTDTDTQTQTQTKTQWEVIGWAVFSDVLQIFTKISIPMKNHTVFCESINSVKYP